MSATADVIDEFIAGRTYMSPWWTLHQSRATLRLGARLGNTFDRRGPGGWIFLHRVEVHRGRDILVPDLAAWRIERMPEVPDTQGAEITPDWVCEITVPSGRSHARTINMPAYARHGVTYAWIVDVNDRTLEVFHLENGRWSIIATYRDEEPVAAEPFESLVLHPDDIYGPAPASPPPP
jgi:Uma2 family endonuclease